MICLLRTVACLAGWLIMAVVMLLVFVGMMLLQHLDPAIRSALEPELQHQAEALAELRAALSNMQEQAKDLHGSLGKIEDKINTVRNNTTIITTKTALPLSPGHGDDD